MSWGGELSRSDLINSRAHDAKMAADWAAMQAALDAQATDNRRLYEVLGTYLGRLVESQDRIGRVLTAILEQHNRVMDEFLTELRMGKVRENYWEARAQELAELAGVDVKAPS